ncbi:MAG: hypothetical protein JSV52_12145, partial [Candidatus Zixiibacteriota bacterium]
WVSRLASGGAEFNLANMPIVELEHLSDEALFNYGIVLAAIEEDGRAAKKAMLHLERSETPGIEGQGIALSSGLTPYSLYVLDFLHYSQVPLLTLDIFLYVLLPASRRRNSRALISRAIAFTYGLCALTSVPVMTLFHNTHGTAVVEELLPSLADTSHVARSLVEETSAEFAPALGEASTEVLRRTWGDLLDVQQQAICRVMSIAERNSRNRIFIGPHLMPQETVTLSVELTGQLRATLGIQPRVRFSRGDAYREIYWLDEGLWQQLRAGLLLANQCGITVYVTAASNRWGGKHPPHSTHRSGKEVDLDWGYYDPAAGEMRTVPNLQRRKKQYYRAGSADGLFYDPRKKRTFDFQPVGRGGADQQTGFDALATWVVIQSLPFVGFNRFLYSDTSSMVNALEHLSAAFPGMVVPEVWPSSQKVSVPRPPVSEEALVEPTGHFNHLHAEGVAEPPFDTSDNLLRITNEVLRELYRLALARDNDPSFKAFFFPNAEGTSGPDSELWRMWVSRRQSGNPALLPIWVS